MLVLSQFIFRLSFGLALGMAITSPRQVTSGYYRNHLYVLLGVNVLALLVALAHPDSHSAWPPAIAAAVSYLGAVCWLYEARTLGRIALVGVAAAAIVGAIGSPMTLASALAWLEPITSGLLLGLTLAAMFLGHWYLNTPTMQLAPLRRLVALMGAAIALRATVSGAELAVAWTTSGPPDSTQIVMHSLRWLAGIVAAAVLAWMTYQTLKIPNTQSATGILYVAVIVSFLGELAAMLMAEGGAFGV